ncbi:MAG: DNA-binding response regulator [Rickettsiales bacterium]|nr:DNA-binding response regulator [Rickettsiales bacterium]
MDTTKHHILVTDDDERIRTLLFKYFQKNGFIVSLAHDAFEAWELIEKIDFDICIFDVMMPEREGFKNGFDLVKKLRAKEFETPILMLTAKGESEERIEGLESGADDYLSKPFEPKELLLRVQSILKRSSKAVQNKQEISIGSYVFDSERGQLLDGSDVVDLTNVETTLLNLLTSKPTHIFSREELAGETHQDPDSRTIDVQITRLRKKIEPDPKTPRYIQTVRGQGYVFRPDY